MSRYEDYMVAKLRQEEIRMKQANKQSDNVKAWLDVSSPEDYPPSISAATGDGFKHYLQGNVLKYLWRFDYKDKPLQDLQKAQWYLNALVEEVMANES